MSDDDDGLRQRRPWSLLLLLVPMAVVVVPPIYARDNPRLAGVPFFVWYQFAAVFFGGIVTAVVYVLRGTEGSLRRGGGGTGGEPGAGASGSAS